MSRASNVLASLFASELISCQLQQEQQIRMSQEEKPVKDVKWSIRPMRYEDIDKCLYIWRLVELTEAHQTVASALAADPDGFYVAELDQTGE